MIGTRTRQCIVSLILVLSGCGGSDISSETDNIPLTATTKYLGTVRVVRDSSDGTTKIAASFDELDNELPVSYLISETTKVLSANDRECEVVTLGAGPSGTNHTPDNLDSTAVSAGNYVLVSAGGSEFARLYPDHSFNYLQANDITSDIPPDLWAALPGGEFPSSSRIPFPQLNKLSNVSPNTGEEMGAEIPFVWDANNADNSRIDIAILVNGSKTIYCSTVDDGHFLLPTETLAELGEEIDFDFAIVTRTSFKHTYDNNALTVTTIGPEPHVIGIGSYVIEP